MNDDALLALDLALFKVRSEVIRATVNHGKFNSPHEGYAVLLEEVDELWDEVKHDNGRGEHADLEATQVAAMAVRYLLDCIRPTDAL